MIVVVNMKAIRIAIAQVVGAKMRKDFLKKIQEEMGGSFYRLNAPGCKFYHFTPIGKSWQGGYTDSPTKLWGDKYCMDLTTGELVK